MLTDCEVVIRGDGPPVRVSITHSGVYSASSSKEGLPKVSISTTDRLLTSLFTGEQKLFTVKKEDIHLSGTMKNMLLVESLLYLSK